MGVAVNRCQQRLIEVDNVTCCLVKGHQEVCVSDSLARRYSQRPCDHEESLCPGSAADVPRGQP